MWSTAMWISVGASLVLVMVALTPVQPQSRRAAKLAMWTLATMGAHYFGLALLVFVIMSTLVATDVAYGLAKHRASTLVQLQISVPTPVLQDPRYRIGIDLYKRETARLQVEKTQHRIEERKKGTMVQTAGAKFREIALRKLSKQLPVATVPAGEPSFVGVPSVWHFMYDCVTEHIRTRLARQKRVRYIGVLGQILADEHQSEWNKLHVAGFGKARHVTEGALLSYSILWYGPEPLERKKPPIVDEAISFRVEQAQIIRCGGFVYLRKRLCAPFPKSSPSQGATNPEFNRQSHSSIDASVSREKADATPQKVTEMHARQIQWHATMLGFVEDSIARDLDRNVSTHLRDTFSVFAPSVFFVVHRTSLPATPASFSSSSSSSSSSASSSSSSSLTVSAEKVTPRFTVTSAPSPAPSLDVPASAPSSPTSSSSSVLAPTNSISLLPTQLLSSTSLVPNGEQRTAQADVAHNANGRKKKGLSRNVSSPIAPLSVPIASLSVPHSKERITQGSWAQQQPLPLSLQTDLVNGERYFWIQTLAADNDTTPTKWTDPMAYIVTLHGIMYWSTVSAARSIRSSYTFVPV